MKAFQRKIQESAHSPRQLEALYQANPEAFQEAFPLVFQTEPGSILFQAWHERLASQAPKPPDLSSTNQWNATDLYIVLAIAFIAGTIAKLPQFADDTAMELFYVRNLGPIIVSAIMSYFIIYRKCDTKTSSWLAGFALVSIVYVNLTPDPNKSDTSALVSLHLPFVFWSLTGVAFLKGRLKDLSGRMQYIRYNGELVIFTTVIMIGGMVMTGITFALFELIDLKIQELYLKTIGLYGGVAAPLVATFLIVQIVGNRLRIAPLLAKIFTPLFLLMTTAYLVTMLANQQSPFTDRDFLIAFNGLLLLVLGLCIFSISERGDNAKTGIPDYLNMALVTVTLGINGIALAAILFRLTSYGFTPNRIAVLGANLLAFTHLAVILFHYLQFARQKRSFENLEHWIVRFLPAYSCWSAFVVFILPLLFRFK